MRPQRRQPTRLPRPWDSPGKNTGVGCHFLLQCMKVKSQTEVAQSCPTLHNPMDYSLPGSSVHGIFQARVLEWGAIAFSSQSWPTLCNPMDCIIPGLPVHHQLLELAQTHVHPVSHAIQPSHLVFPLSSYLQSFSASGSFPMSQFFASGGQSIGASASVFPMNIQDWFPLGWAGFISLLFKGLPTVFSNTTVQKHQFFGAQLSL